MTSREEGSMVYIAYAGSSVGALTLTSADGATLLRSWIDGQKYDRIPLEKETMRKCGTDNLAIFREATRWLKLYLSGQEPNFYPWLSFSGSEFRKEIARKMLSVPYGHTASCKRLTENLAAWQGKSYVPPHAIGGAVAHSLLLILIPCHHIIGADGCLTGYAGGLGRKKHLLALEAGQL